MDITIIGGGYVGLTTAVAFASLGNNVRIIDVDEEKVRKINDGIAPIYEEGLQEMMNENMHRIKATSSYDEIDDVVFICVGTPSMPDGSINLDYVMKAVDMVSDRMESGLIIIKSTVFPGTTERLLYPMVEKKGKDISMAMNPEFLREGVALHDFLYPDRIVIGVMDERGEKVLKELYSPIDAPVLVTTPTTAEMIKYASNALLATKISFANEVGNLSKMLGIDVYEVMKGVTMDHRISPYFLNAGAGFGGSCFPKDLRALREGAKKMGYEMRIVNAVLEVNERQPLKMIELLEKYVEARGSSIAVLGLAFKANTDDIRESRSIPLIRELLKKGANVKAYDPMAMDNMKKIFPEIEYCNSVDDALKDADACLIMTDWNEFKNIDFSGMKRKIVIEGRRILENKEGIIYEGICW
ncbi:MAG: UDP-glucose/GDP-mannose dehydrogenase family protein [Thermoplasmata archaeon]|nr:UDP-glucose/GDP-mannose dehydrogenase family protein [Thermoplasmata archaeon]